MPRSIFSEHYIEAQTSLVERSLRTLKEGDAFAVLDTYGDCGTVRDSPEGLFFRDTRYLSRFELRLEGRRPLLLGSVIQDDNASLTVDLTNPDLGLGEDSALPRDLIAIDRTKFLWKGSLYERIGLRNYDSRSRTFRVELSFDADFRDLFEVRGMRRDRRGHRTVERTAPDESPSGTRASMAQRGGPSCASSRRRRVLIIIGRFSTSRSSRRGAAPF